MSYQGSCLTEREWGKALDDSVACHKDQITAAIKRRDQIPPARPALEARVLEHIKRIAESDPAYAWWACNHYQRLGESKSSNQLFQDLPQQFIDFENQGKT